MSYRVTYDFSAIDEALGVDGVCPPFCDIDISSELTQRGTSPAREYWAQFTKEERRAKMAKLSAMRKKPGPGTGWYHTEATKAKMSKAATGTKKPTLYKGGTVVKDGNVVEFTCLSHFCKENGLSSGHMCELLKGKRKSVKGWKLWAP